MDQDADHADPADQGAPQEEERSSSGKNLTRSIFKWSAIVIAGIAVLLAALLLGLNTGPGKRLVADQIAALEFENGLEIDVGRIEGSIYGEMVLHDVALSDPEGTFLVSPEVRVDWRPFAFVNSHIDIRSLTSRLVTLQRLPEFNEVTSDGPLLPDYEIDIAELRIDSFVAGKDVSGERRAGSIAGSVAIEDRQARIEVDAKLEGGDQLAGLIDAVPDDGVLDLDLDLNAPADGVLAAIIGLDQPLSAELKGAGDWAEWKGSLDAELDGSEFARLDLTARDGAFELRGPTRIARLFEGQTAALLGPVLDVDLTATLAESKVALAGNVTSDALRLNTNGLIDTERSAFDDLKLNFVLLNPTALAENLRGSGLRAQLTLDGAFATPLANYVVAADRLAFNDTGFENLRATGEARVDANRLIVPVSASVSRITGYDTIAGGTLRDVRLSGDLAIDGPRVLSDNMRITNDRINAGVILVADTSTGLYAAAVDGRIDNYRVASVGIFNVETEVDLETQGSGFAITGRVRASSTSLDSDGVREFLGGNLVGGADIRYGTDGVTRFSNLTLRSPLVRVTRGSGTYSADGQLSLTAAGVTDVYGPVGVRVAGTLSNPDAIITAQRPGFGIGLANVRARLRAARAGYRVSATGDTDYGKLNANVLLGMGDQLTVDVTDGDFAGIGFSGLLRQTAAGPFAGRINVDDPGVAGVVRLDAEGEYQQAIVYLRAQNAILEGPSDIAIGSGRVDARLVLYDQPLIVGEAEFAKSRIGIVDVLAARGQIAYRDGAGDAQFLLEGESGVPFRVAGNAELQPDLWRAALKGKMRGIEFATDTPARIIPKANEYELRPTRIEFGSGSIRLAGNYGEGIKLQSRLDRLDMAIIDAFVPGLGISGRATGSLDFQQETATSFPRADARLQIADFSRTTAVSVSQPVDINFVGALLPDGGEARAVARRRGSVIGRLNATLQPLPPGSGDWVTRLLSAPLGGGIRYNGPADTLFSFAGQADQRMSGPIAVAADFSGLVESPQLEGIVRANALTYENQTYGTRLSDMAIDARFAGDRFEIDRLTATVGDGTLSAEGYVSLAEANGYPMDIAITLDDARIARSDELSATASGQFRLTKSAGQNALLSGDLTLPDARYQVSQQQAAEIPNLTGVRFKPPKGRERITGDEPALPRPGLFEQVRLDIGLIAPERLYVTGMGLESEWSANLTLSGTSADPQISGDISLVRGTLGFAGRSFELADGGRLSFSGGRTIDPVINLVASEDIEDVSVNVEVTGRAYDPQIAFSSVPGLPQDEIISRILFGNSVGNLSTIQAVQLAASLNSLRGGSGGLNPLGELRSATGIDRLRILSPDEESGRGTALAVGQYLTDDIYIELITDARGFTATQLEVSLTPFLSVLSQAGGSGATNVNVRFRKNY